MTQTGFVHQALYRVGQELAYVGGLFGDELLDQSTVERRNGQLLISPPCQQNT